MYLEKCAGVSERGSSRWLLKLLNFLKEKPKLSTAEKTILTFHNLVHC